MTDKKEEKVQEIEMATLVVKRTFHFCSFLKGQPGLILSHGVISGYWADVDRVPGIGWQACIALFFPFSVLWDQNVF